MALKYTAQIKPKSEDKTSYRRRKTVAAIDQQIKLAVELDDAVTSRKAWFWPADDGYLLSIRYGRKDLELAKGMFSIKCNGIDEVEQALRDVRSMTLKGDLDEPLRMVSEAIRSRFRPD